MVKKILEIQKLTKYYGNILGIKDLSLTLEEGEIFGFIGPNGSGKSTTIKSIMNLINKDIGKIYFYGKELKKDDIDIKKMIGYLPSEIHLYDDLTVKEIFDYHEKFYSKNIRKRRIELIKKFKVDETKKIEDLSLGNLKKVGIILAFMHEPKLVILDEPTSGLDPIMQQKFYELLLEEKEKGTTIFYSTHILSEIAKICDRIAVIKDGILVKVENKKQLHKENLVVITISSEMIDDIIRDLNINVDIDRINGDTIKFKSSMDINILINKLSNYKIKKLLIEEVTIEELILNYYK